MRSADLLKIAALMLLILVGLVLNWLYQRKRRKRIMREQEFFVKSRKKGASYRLLKLYRLFSGFRPAMRYLERLRKVYEIRMPGNSRECKESAMRLALCIWGISGAAIACVFIFRMSLYHIACCILAAYVLSSQIVTSRFERYDNRILKELDSFIDIVQFHFFMTKMPEEALIGAIQETQSKLMKLHAQQILDVLGNTEDYEEAIKDYNMRNTDYFVKAFAEAIFITFQYGDRTVDGMSLFVSTLHSVRNDIRNELLKRRILKTKFSCVQGCIVIPVYCLDLLKGIGADNFASLADLYAGTYGYVCMLFLFVATVALYRLAGRLRTFTKVEKENTLLLGKIYSFPIMKKVVDSVCARNWGRTVGLQTMLKKIGSSLTTQLFLTKRIVYFCLTFVALVIFVNCLHVHNRSYYLESVSDVASASSGTSDEEGLQMMLLSRYYIDKYKVYDIREEYNKASGKLPVMSFNGEARDWLAGLVSDDIRTDEIQIDPEMAFNVCQDFLEEHTSTSNNIKNLAGLTYDQAAASSDHMVVVGLASLEKIVQKAERADPLDSAAQLDMVADGAAGKIQKSQNEYFHWYELLLVFAMAILAYQLPYVIMLYEKKELQMDMEDEVVQFQSVILVLMHVERMTVEKVLEWMLMFSRIFEPSLRKCVNEMPLDYDKALGDLKEDEPYEIFGRLVNGLIMSDKIGIKRAFNNLKNDRLNYQETRKVENSIMADNRGAFGQLIMMVPIGLVTAFWLVLPFLMAAIGDLLAALQSLSTVG